jgi:polyisoprenoid-binding protein YceI
MTIDTPTELSTLTGSWVLDTQRTTIEFQTKILWIFPVKGTFQARRGWGQLTADGFLTGALVIDTGSINTGISKRNNHLRSADFFDVDNYPTIIYTVSQAMATDTDQVELLGKLDIHGHARPVTLVAHVGTSVGSLTVSTVVDMDRSDWGISTSRGPGKGRSLKSRVVINAHFNKA